MARVPHLDESQSDPFGPDASTGPRPERYNTRYIVANLKKSELRTRLTVVGIIALVLVVVVLFLLGSPSGSPEPASAASAAGAPTAAPARQR